MSSPDEIWTHVKDARAFTEKWASVDWDVVLRHPDLPAELREKVSVLREHFRRVGIVLKALQEIHSKP